MEFAKNNHYVPQFYLEQWSKDRQKVYQYDLLVPDARVPLWKPKYIAGSGSKEHLYTLSSTGADSDEMERWFNTEIETPAQLPFEAALRGYRMTVHDWHKLIRLYALQEGRTPSHLVRFLESFPGRAERWFQETVDDAVATGERIVASGERLPVALPQPGPPLPAFFEKAIEPGAEMGTLKVTLSVSRDLWLHTVYHMVTSTHLALRALRWTVLTAPHGSEWVTSDHPAVCTNNGKFFGLDKSVGWRTVGAEHFMPLSPRKLLYARVGSRAPLRDATLSMSEAERINRLIVLRAHRVVYAQEENQFVLRSRARWVDLPAYLHEQEQWKSFHAEHSQASQPPISKSDRPFRDAK